MSRVHAFDKRTAEAAYLRDVASEVASREKQGGRQGRRRGTSGGARLLLSLLLLAFCAALLYAGPIYPSTVQQLHLHLRLPQASQNLEVNLGAGGLLAADSVRTAVTAAVSGASTSTLSFEVCSGFAHQRVDIVSGLILAVELNRTLVLPRLLLDGSQPSDGQDSDDDSVGSVEFGEMFDVNAFLSRLSALGVHASVNFPPPSRTTAGRLADFDSVQALRSFYASRQHLRVDCPAFRVPAELVTRHEKLVFAALDALRPAQPLQAIIDRAEEQLRSMSGSHAFNVLQLRAEDEWLSHCANWESIGDGVVRNNCMNNTARVGNQLRLHRVDRQVPLLLSIRKGSMSSSLVQQALQNLEAHSYKVVVHSDIFGRAMKVPVLSREEAELVDYYLALGCQQFVGNSVSVSSALLIMERWHAGRFATYYNGGNIPLEAFMPLFQMPWVFTYNDWSAGTEYDYMVKAAVTSGIEVARMKPYCMYSGSTTSEMYQWFLSKGVTIIQHEPAWRDALVKEGARNKEANLAHSHLYKTGGTLVGTFQRIDIPILRQFDQYNYVLFTDCDVYFRQQMKLVDWGTPLPTAVGMGFEGQDIFPYNAGIMLMNMPYMRKTNKKFLSWILSQKNGLYYPGYGPLDQGALNQFYEAQVKGRPISKDFNAMLFHQYRQNARIVHMNGPKPNHYLEWLENRTCAFGDMCKMGLGNGVCQYIAEYVQFTANWDVPARLHKLCASGAAAQALQQASAAQQAAAAAVEPQQAAVAEHQDEDADDADINVDQEAPLTLQPSRSHVKDDKQSLRHRTNKE